VTHQCANALRDSGIERFDVFGRPLHVGREKAHERGKHGIFFGALPFWLGIGNHKHAPRSNDGGFHFTAEFGMAMEQRSLEFRKTLSDHKRSGASAQHAGSHP